MTQEQALRIATNFHTFRQGGAPMDMTLKRIEGGSRFIFRTISLADDEMVYEIILDPLNNEIVMKEIVAEYLLTDFMQQPCKLSELEKGDLFRNEGDCVVWRYYGIEMQYGRMRHGITRENGGEIYWECDDTTVYPCGK